MIFKNYLLLCLTVVLLIGCKKDPLSVQGEEQNVIMQEFEIITRAQGGDDPNALETDAKITSAVVYIYNAGTDILNNKNEREVNAQNPGEVVIDNEGKLNKKWRVPIGRKDVYVIVNPPAELKPQLTDQLTQTKLSAITSYMPVMLDMQTRVLMSGKKTDVALSSQATSVKENINIKRRVARFDFFLRKDISLKDAKVSCKELRYDFAPTSCFVFEQKKRYMGNNRSIIFVRDMIIEACQSPNNIWSDNQSDYEKVASFCACEQPKPNTAYSASLCIEINNIPFHVPLYLCSSSIGKNQSGNDKDKPMAIEANKIYRVMATISKQKSGIALNITDWNEQEIPVDLLEGQKLSAPSKVIMDWWNLNKSFSTTLIMESYPKGIFFVGYEYNGITTTDGSNLPAWLPKDNITNLPNGYHTAKVGLTYVCDSAQNKQPVKLWFKTGNIKKCVTVVYDNGYLPNDLLAKAEWKNNQPAGGGLIIAKKGNRYPCDVADDNWERERMMWDKNRTLIPSIRATGPSNGELHGKGYVNTQTAYKFLKEKGIESSVLNTCINMGPKWYIPSRYELGTINKLHNYLGDSYRYSTDGSDVSPYWSSTESASSFLCMQYVSFHNNNVENAGKGFTHVRTRCVRNAE